MKTPAIISRGSFFSHFLLILSTLVLFAGCATLAASLNPKFRADRLAYEAHFLEEGVQTDYFNLRAYSRINNLGQELTVYIEGDGRAWLSKHKLSNDPTPFHPLVLQLATQDNSANVAYLARPCQYTYGLNEKNFDPVYWSTKRFSEEVIASMNQAVDHLVQKAQAPRIHLIAYSGGAAVAVLIAARRSDVASLRTISGNLDPEAVNRHHKVTALEGSLNPMVEAPKISIIPQRHFRGVNDKIIPSFVPENFLRASLKSCCVQVTTVEGADHHHGWEEKWKDLLSMPVVCADP